MQVKIQRPMLQANGGQLVLVYDKERTEQLFIPLTKELLILMGSKYKIYAKARIKGKNLEIMEVLEDMDW